MAEFPEIEAKQEVYCNDSVPLALGSAPISIQQSGDCSFRSGKKQEVMEYFSILSKNSSRGHI